jgi:hypothetical protein
MSAHHPLAVFLATEAQPLETQAYDFPGYDPATQLQGNWNGIANHLEVLCSDAHTGEPSTQSHTTSFGPHNENPDLDTDDSGT